MSPFVRKCAGGSEFHRQQVDRLLKVFHALFVVFEVALVFFLLTLFTFMVVDDTLNHRDCSSETDASEAADTDVYKNCANHDCLHSLLPPLVKKIIVVISCKVRFSRCLTAKRLAIMNLLQTTHHSLSRWHQRS